MPPRPLSSGKSVKLMVVAASGWGKTRLAGTSAGTALFIRPPIDYVDSILPEDQDRHLEWVVQDWSAMEDVQEHLRHEGEKYSWVWFDSISGYQDIGLDDIWDTVVTEKPARKRYGLDKGDYGINMQRLGRWVRDIATISDAGAFNFGITAWPAELSPSPDDDEVPEKIMPWVQGKNMSMKVCGYTNIVAFGEITAKGTRVLRFQETDRMYCKDQFDMFPDYKLLNPTIPKIEAAVNGKRSAAKPAQTTRRRRAVRRGK